MIISLDSLLLVVLGMKSYNNFSNGKAWNKVR